MKTTELTPTLTPEENSFVAYLIYSEWRDEARPELLDLLQSISLKMFGLHPLDLQGLDTPQS
jgi:hypothetical protein